MPEYVFNVDISIEADSPTDAFASLRNTFIESGLSDSVIEILEQPLEAMLEGVEEYANDSND